MNDLMTIDDIANLIGLPRAYVRDKLVKTPEFPPPTLRISQRIRKWSAGQVRDWMNKQAEQAAR